MECNGQDEETYPHRFPQELVLAVNKSNLSTILPTSIDLLHTSGKATIFQQVYLYLELTDNAKPLNQL